MIASAFNPVRKIPIKNSDPLIVEAVVRTIPGQREVVRGVWNGAAVYAKIFSGARASAHIARDVAGVKALLAHNIVTPALLYEGEVEPADASNQSDLVVIYAAIEDAVNAEVAYAALAKDARVTLLIQLVETIAQHHAAGLYQSDLHFKNFLVAAQPDSAPLAALDLAKNHTHAARQNLIYTLDGDGIRPLPSLLKQRKMRQNLATFFSKMDVLDVALIPQLYAQYCATVGMTYHEQAAQQLINKTAHIRRQVASEYADSKVFRNCTDVKLNHFSQTHCLTKLFRPCIFTWLARPYVHLADKLNIEAMNACLTQPVFKAGNTCTVSLLNVADSIHSTHSGTEPLATQQVVVKRYNIKNIWHGFSRSLRTTRAAISWANAHRLILLGLPTATPIALIEKRYLYNMIKSHSYFVTDYIDAPDVASYFAAEKDQLKRAEVMREIATLFYKLYLLNISHGDLKASNLKIDQGKPVLIDLDSMKQHRFAWVANRKHARDLKRFMRNWQTSHAHHAAIIAAFKKIFKVVYADHKPLLLAGLLY